MSEIQVIESALQKAAQRRRWARALRGLWHGLFIGAVISFLLIVAWHLPLSLPPWTVLVAAAAPFPAMLTGFIVGGWRKTGLGEAARWVDGRQHLQERLSTALEVSGTAEGGAWRELVVTDAANHVRDLDPKRLLPFGLPRATRWALVLLALGAGLGFVPEYRTQSFRQKEKEAQNIKDVGRQLAEFTRRNLAAQAPTLESTQKSLEAVAQTAEQLMTKSIPRTEAVSDLRSAADKIKEDLKDLLAKEPGLKKLEEASRSPGSDSQQNASSLQKEIEALQKQLGKPTGNPDEMDKLKSDLDKLQQAAKAMADSTSGSAQTDREKLSEALSALSKQMQDMGMQTPQLDHALEALAANQAGLVLKDLQEATTSLEELRDKAKTLAQLQQQMQKLGKDLAEQLKNGQPEAAQMTLQKMAQQLQSANPPSDKLQQIMKDVSNAVHPAGNYGKVGEKLSEALKQMQAAQQSQQSGSQGGGQSQAQAAQSLQAAADELGKLAQQMGDAQSLQAELQALNQAAAAMASGQGWKPSRRPGAGRGGQPGSGVGTWAEDNAQWDGQWSQQWDNSGVSRPDEDPRGHTDRGEGELTEALKPTKVKGTFSPGAPMPSITLKGVSIKGESTVDYDAAAMAAQSDAQNALSQDKVPRAYQGAVKGYFDDMKR
jgi:hypothetical protein